jgi:hypothetical protein
MSVEEFKERKSFSIGFIAGGLAIAFNIGFIYANMLAADKEIIKNAKQAKEYTEQEVGGLRADWERQNAILKLRDAEMAERIKELEEYHKE